MLDNIEPLNTINELYAACENGDFQEVKQLLAENPRRFIANMSTLYVAVENGHTAIYNYLSEITSSKLAESQIMRIAFTQYAAMTTTSKHRNAIENYELLDSFFSHVKKNPKLQDNLRFLGGRLAISGQDLLAFKSYFNAIIASEVKQRLFWAYAFSRIQAPEIKDFLTSQNMFATESDYLNQGGLESLQRGFLEILDAYLSKLYSNQFQLSSSFKRAIAKAISNNQSVIIEQLANYGETFDFLDENLITTILRNSDTEIILGTETFRLLLAYETVRANMTHKVIFARSSQLTLEDFAILVAHNIDINSADLRPEYRHLVKLQKKLGMLGVSLEVVVTIANDQAVIDGILSDFVQSKDDVLKITESTTTASAAKLARI